MEKTKKFQDDLIGIFQEPKTADEMENFMPKTKTISDEVIISALLMSPTLDAAAKQCGLSVRQMYDRRQDADFMRKLTEAQAQALASTTRYLQASTSTAAQTLVEIASSSYRPPQVRIAAARAILEQATKYTETVDIQGRLEALERYAEGGTDDEH